MTHDTYLLTNLFSLYLLSTFYVLHTVLVTDNKPLERFKYNNFMSILMLFDQLLISITLLLFNVYLFIYFVLCWILTEPGFVLVAVRGAIFHCNVHFSLLWLLLFW